MDISPFDPEEFAWPEFDLEIQVAGFAASNPRRALTRQADALPLFYALGNLYVQRALFACNVPAAIKFRCAQGDASRCSPVSILEINEHLSVMIFTVRMYSGVSLIAPCGAKTLPEQGLEKIAVG